MVILIMACLQIAGFANEEHQTEWRKFKHSSIEKITESDYFFYLEKEESNRNALYTISDWIFRMLRFILGNKVAQGLMSNFHLIILFIALILIFMKIANLSPSKIFYTAKKIPAEHFSIDEQLVNSVDFTESIENAFRKKNYRLALRYHYLELLKILVEKGIIEWDQHKTNYEIENELGEKAFRDKFRSLALIFEYVWYGEFKISESRFLEVRNDFLALKKQIL